MASIRVNLTYNVINNVLRILYPLITAPYVSRVLSPEDLGLYAFSSSYASYFTIFAVLGIPYYGTREIAKVRNDTFATSRLFSELFSIGCFITIVISTLYVASLSFIDRFNQQYTLFLLIGIGLYCSPFNIDWFYRGIEKFKYITIRSIIIKILCIVSLFVFVRTKEDLLIYVIIAVSSTVVSDLWNFVVFLKSGYRVSIRYKGWKKHIEPLLLLFFSTIAISIYTLLDKLMLGFMASYEQVAFYHYAMHISKALLTAITSLSAVALPRVSYYFENQQYNQIEQLLSKSCSLVVFFSVPLCVIISIISPTLVPLFLGDAFDGSVVPLQILSLLLVLIGLNNLFAVQCLVALGYDKLFLYSVLSGTIINFILNLLLIPNFGAVGASVASVIAEFCVLALSYYFVIKYSKLKVAYKREYGVSFLVAFTFIPLYYLVSGCISGWLLILLFVSLCSLVYVYLQYCTNNSTLLLIVKLVRKRYEYLKG